MKYNSKHICVAISVLVLSASASAVAQTPKDSIVVKPWGIEQKASENAGSTVTVSQEDLEHFAATDFMNRLTGLFPGLEVRETSGSIFSNNMSLLPGGPVSLSSRGNSDIICIVDDIPISYDFLCLEPEQIESVTFLNNTVDKALYTPIISSGALYITTKKGGYDTASRVSASVESGIGIVDKWPEWVNGSDYARLNNQARSAAGYEQLYSGADLTGIAKGDPNDLINPNVDYKSLLYNNFKPITRFGVNAQGGSSSTKYNISVAGLNNNSFSKAGGKEDFNKINVNTNITTKLSDYIEASIGAIGMTSFMRGNTGYSFGLERTVPAVAHPLTLNADIADADLKDVPVYAVSKSFPDNPYAQVLEGGQNVIKSVSGLIDLTINTDLSFILPGLKSRTFADISSYFYEQIGKNNDYFALYWEPGVDVADLERSAHVNKRQSEKSVLASASYQSWQAYERLTYDFARNGHKLNAGLTYNMFSADRSGNTYYERTQSLIANASYNYDGRFFADLVLNYSGSTRFDRDSRFVLFPTAAFGWRPVRNVKIYVQSGLIGANDLTGAPYLYNGKYSLQSGVKWGQDPSNAWFGGTTQVTNKYTSITRMANPDLTWSKLFQNEIGVEAELFDGFSAVLDGYYIKSMGLISECSGEFPELAGSLGTTFYDNAEDRTTYGADLTLRYRKNIGDFRLDLAGSASTYKNIISKPAVDIYQYEWQKLAGTSITAIRGLNCIGKFTSEAEIASSATWSKDAKVGDLKYEDLNGDGTIDNNDSKVIGDARPKMIYYLNLNLGWKNFDLSVIGSGRAFSENMMINEYFWNGWGDGVYSAFVRDNIGDAYPRLSYEKSADNFVQSNFWMRDCGYFKIQNVELAYTFRFAESKAIKSMRVALRGSNLLTITNLKYVDPECADLGVTTEPLAKLLTAGVKFNF